MSDTTTDAPEKDEKNWFESVVEWFKEAADWVQENLGDPALASTLREDLGLKPGESIPPAKKGEFATFAAGLDPDKTAFSETVAEITEVVQAFIALGDSLADGDDDAFEVFYLLGMVATAESVRLRVPWVYALGKILLFVTDQEDELDQIDPAVVVGALRGEGVPEGASEALLQRIMAPTAVAIAIAEHFISDQILDSYYGWDPDPASTTPQADLLSTRALTMVIGTPGEISAQLGVTILGVPPEHNGPALFLSFGGSFTAEQDVGDVTYRFQAGITGALDLIVPLASGVQFEAGGDPSGFIRLDVLKGTDDKPALTIGDADGTRVEIEKMAVGVELSPSQAAFRFGAERGVFVIDLTEGDGFLGQLPGGDIRITFGLIFIADTEHGIRIEGGTSAKATLPVNTSLFGVFTIHHLELALGTGSDDSDVGIELSGAFGLNLGPFRASVDRMGFLFEFARREGNLGIIDASIGFKPPKGIGLVLDAGPAKGGGYLFIDTARGEYAGVLDLTIGPVSVKALGILSTRMPDGSEGWSLLLMVFGTFPAVQLSFGFTLTGLGGVIGLNHAVSIDALQSGFRQGILDDILFPADPVANAPRLINQLRTVFPATPRALTFGPMIELGWSTPSIMIIRMGVIVQLDNALGSGPGGVEFGRFVLVGQLIVQLPPKATEAPALLKLLIDIIGYYDSEEQRLGFRARLRDSFVGLGEKGPKLNLTGELIVQADFGDNPSFVLAAGGFHPRFKDIPAGVPAKVDRLGVNFKIGIVKITFQGYFAVTPATVQTGAEIRIQAKIGPVGIDGFLGFDAIFYFEPRFHFEVDIRAGVSIKFKSFKLASVTLTMTLSGPGLWRAVGKVSFSVLWWDISKSFDVSTGSAPETPPTVTDVAALVQQALSEPGAWTAQLPPAGAAIASIGEITGVQGLLAHPLGSLEAVQRVVPLGLELEKFGETTIAGASRFDIGPVTIGDENVTSPTRHRESFARSQFIDMSDDEKLSSPSFEKFDAGFSVGTDSFGVPSDEVRADLEYETHILEPPREEALAILVPVFVHDRRVRTTDAKWQARLGAAGRSVVRIQDRLKTDARTAIAIDEPPLAFVDADTLAPANAAPDLDGAAATATTIAGQLLTDAADSGITLVEAYEVEG